MRSTRKPPKRLFRPRKPAAVAGLAVNQAMATWGKDCGPSGSILVVCARIGDAATVPPGYLTADCDSCQHAVWLNPDVQAMAERMRMKIVCTCTRCLRPDAGDRPT